MIAAWTTYTLTLIAVTAAPGPIIAILASRSLAGDVRGALMFGTGVVFGDLVAIALVVLGLGDWLLSMPGVLTAAKLLGVAYILWLAFGMWRGAAMAAATGPEGGRSLGAGFVLSLASPQTVLMYLALLPVLLTAADASILQIWTIVPVTIFAMAVVMVGVVGATSFLGRIPGGNAGFWRRIMAVLVATSGGWLLAI